METLVDILDDSVQRYGSNTALKFWSHRESYSWSYKEMDETSRLVASMLKSIGILKGDRVLIWGPNRPEWVAALLGCFRAGAIAVPFDLRAKEDFLLRIIDKAQPKVLIAGREQMTALPGMGNQV
ncbi:MAG: AMP-binding protein, partial [Dehalococcoidia bacterium]|nr:AMP-binding protein [Dehalococcoidia bacterium]